MAACARTQQASQELSFSCPHLSSEFSWFVTALDRREFDDDPTNKAALFKSIIGTRSRGWGDLEVWYGWGARHLMGCKDFS